MKSKLKKFFFILISSIFVLVLLIILFISPITKYLVEKYDEKYIGRQITMAWAYVNPFTGYLHFDNLKIYESKSDSVFISLKGLSINFEMLKLFRKTYEISNITLDHPHGIIIQNKEGLNFNDIIKRFSSEDTLQIMKEKLHFNILNISITDGEFFYHEKTIPINYSIKEVNIESPGKWWNSDTMDIPKISFLPGIGSGTAKGSLRVNLETLDYRLTAIINKLDLNIIQQYLKDLTNYGTFKANLDADVKATGNFAVQEKINASGMIAINDFHFGKNPKEDYASFKKLNILIHQINPVNKIYYYDSVTLSNPYIKYERYDYLDNVQTIFGKKGANISAAKADNKFNLVIEIADYIKVISRNFFKSNYRIDRAAIYNANVRFNDFSSIEKFSVELNPLTITSDSIHKEHKRVNIYLKSGIKPYGDANIALSINPKDSSDFDLVYKIEKLPASLFNPYIISQTSFPLDRGTIELNGKWEVRNGEILSTNHLIIIDPRSSERIRNKGAHWLPMRIIMAFVRERGNVIDYEIPITGDLKNAKFHLHDVIFDALENIFVKPVTIPYRMEVKNIEREIEKSLTLKWEMRDAELSKKQTKFLEKMADFLEENPTAAIVVTPQNYLLKEKEYILFYEAKKKYFLAMNSKNDASFADEDSEKVDKMSVKDTLFVHYVDKQLKDSMLFTIQAKCTKYVGENFITTKFKQLNKVREEAFLAYFKEKKVEQRIKFSKSKNVIPYNGFSFYKIVYKGEFPESLMYAYRAMNELDNKAPRKKFREERRKNRDRDRAQEKMLLEKKS